MSLHNTLPNNIKEALKLYEKDYFDALSSTTTSIQNAVKLLHESTGKGVRPIILLLIAGTYGDVDAYAVNGAVFIELLHVATLIHDDIIDDSNIRRGHSSLNASIGNHKAVLMGDFILSTSMIRATNTGNLRVLSSLSKLGRFLSEGEFKQMDTAENGIPTEAQYYDVIRYKTASLMSTSIEIGALLSGEKDDQILSALYDAGDKLGLAFQIKDDILDYTSSEATLGKPTGNDLREHKVTLPLIYALHHIEGEEADRMRALIKDNHHLSEQEITDLIDFAIRSGGIDYAERQARILIDECKEIFIKLLKPNESRDALLQLCDFIGNRKS